MKVRDIISIYMETKERTLRAGDNWSYIEKQVENFLNTDVELINGKEFEHGII